MDELNVVNDTQGATVEPQVDNTNISNTPVDGGSEPNISSQSNEKPVQDKETNAVWMEMRKAREAAETRASQLEKDFTYFQKYNNLGVKNEAELKQAYGHEGINTWEDVDHYYEAQEKNIDPQFYKEFNEMKQELNAYKSEKQMKEHDEMLSKDEKIGSIYNKLRTESMEMAKKYNVDLRTGYTLALEQKAADLFKEPDVESIKQQGIKEYIERIKSGNTPIESSGNTATIVNSTPKTWGDAKKGALAYLRATKENK